MLSNEVIEQASRVRLMPLKARKDQSRLLVHEIYSSVQGESTFVGLPCVFVRTTACHLRCRYCDTEQAFFRGQEMSHDQVIHKVVSYEIPLALFTGGEPLLQPSIYPIMETLCDQGFTVMLETSGAVSIDRVDKRVHVVLDIKTPASGEHSRNIWSNLSRLWPQCQVKFVVCDENDYRFAKEIMVKHRLSEKCEVLISPEWNSKIAPQLAEWIVRDRLAARFQLQIHKVLWGNKSGV